MVNETALSGSTRCASQSSIATPVLGYGQRDNNDRRRGSTKRRYLGERQVTNIRQPEVNTAGFGSPQMFTFALAHTFVACSGVRVTPLGATSPGRFAITSASPMPIFGSSWQADIAHDSSVRCASSGIPAAVKSVPKALLTMVGVGDGG